MANGPATTKKSPKGSGSTSPVDNFFALASKTQDDAGGTGLDGPIGGKQDAYRHALWMARMRDRYGAAVASAAGLAHEAAGVVKGAPLDETVMDLQNNAVGLKLAEEVRDPAARESRLREMAEQAPVAEHPKTFSDAWKALFEERLVRIK